MRKYLSNYWIKNCIFATTISCFVAIVTIVLIFLSDDAEDFIPIVCCLLYLVILFILIYISLNLVRYVIEECDNLVMYNVFGKKISEIRLDSDIFCEELPLVEGMYSRQVYVILSNYPFESYQKRGFFQLAKVCKFVDANGKQIIMRKDSTADTVDSFKDRVRSMSCESDG